MQYEVTRATNVRRNPTADPAERRREQCRRNQARYRKKRHEYTLHLEQDIAWLRNQVPQLERQHVTMLSVIPTTASVWCVAVEYFRLFRRGYKAPVVLHDGYGVPYELKEQFNFLRAAMAPDVTDGWVYGPEAIMEQWKCYSLCHGDLNIELQGLQRGPQGCIVASTMTSVTVTEEMLRHAFPHLLKDAAGQSLAAKLLGWRFVMCGSVRFDWDDDAGRVKSLAHQSDILTPMLKQLSSLDNVARVFDQARITLDDNVN
ncbi:hypothetical protein V7S43_017290 [Phytophthora oleae]|uniref:BZIP domain-containing protein n=1 Tax=Phytophthora oleae TaxID=2107226 RepID=A0ABD3EXC8_9STRA